MKNKNINTVLLVTFLYAQSGFASGLVDGDIAVMTLIQEMAQQHITLSSTTPSAASAPAVAISSLLDMPYAQLQSTLGVTFSVVTEKYSKQNFNIDFQGTHGLSLCPTAGCTTDVWGHAQGTDISSIVNLPNLATTGITIVVLASANGNYVSNVGVQKPDTLYILAYDGTTPTTPLQKITVTAGSTNFIDDQKPWGNIVWIGGFGSAQVTTQYPFALTFNSTKVPSAAAAVPTAPVASSAIPYSTVQSIPNYSQLSSTIGITLNPISVQGFTGAVPSFDFTYGTNTGATLSTAGFWFGAAGTNAWSAAAAVNDLTSTVYNQANVNWKTGVTLVTLPFDASNNVISDITKITPASFYVFGYDAVTGNRLGNAQLTPTTSANSPYFSNSVPWSNAGELAVQGISSVSKITHPMAITFTNTGTPAISTTQTVVSRSTAGQLQTLMTAANSGYASFKNSLQSMLKGSTFSEVTASNSAQTVPWFNFNFNFGGFMFFSNGGWSGATVINMPSNITLNWAQLLAFAIVASDSSGNIIPSLPTLPLTTAQTALPNFTLFIFGGSYSLPFIMSANITSYTFQNTAAQSSGGNNVAIGSNLPSGTFNTDYPFAFIVTPQ